MQRQILQETRQNMINIQISMKEMLRDAEIWKTKESEKLNNIKVSHSKNLDKIECKYSYFFVFYLLLTLINSTNPRY